MPGADFVRRELLVRTAVSRAKVLVGRASAYCAESIGGVRFRPAAARVRPFDARPVALVMVYRRRNADYVRELLAEAVSLAGTAALWCLEDEPPAEFASWTVGTGPGPRCALLNRCFEAIDDGSSDVLIADDDVVMPKGAIRTFLGLCALADLDLAQPAHTWRSHASYVHTRARPLSVVRMTRFVEVGPVVFVSRRAAGRVFPMPQEFGMGWGLDHRWSHEFSHPGQLGIVDAVLMTHMGAVGAAYRTESSDLERVSTEFRKAQSRPRFKNQVWRPWQTAPPWAHTPG
jgi:hypothetical protein